MVDRPIIFSGPMVQALLAGRKTQTRRVLKPQPPKDARFSGIYYASDRPDAWFFNTPHGGFQVRQAYEEGDRLWVREAITRFDHGTCDQHVWYRGGANYRDAPDDHAYRRILADGDAQWPADANGPGGGKPYPVSPIHMPRWASRLTLAVTNVRVERLQDISETDAVAEGMTVNPGYWSIRHFAETWNAIHGPDAWEADPWICVLTFTVEPRNIDDLTRERHPDRGGSDAEMAALNGARDEGLRTR